MFTRFSSPQMDLGVHFEVEQSHPFGVSLGCQVQTWTRK